MNQGLDRVLIVVSYDTPEMDYFSEKALPFLTDLVDRYSKAGVKLNALYDTMSGIAGRVTAHEPFDVLVMPVPLIDGLNVIGSEWVKAKTALLARLTPLLPPIDQWGALPLPLQRLSPHSLSRRVRDLLAGDLGEQVGLALDLWRVLSRNDAMGVAVLTD